jgi:hypothetical protein
MIRKFNVEVVIDTETDSADGRSIMQTIDENSFKISIRKDIKHAGFGDKYVPIVLAHEFGHVIGYSLGLPRSDKDPRNKLGSTYSIGNIYKILTAHISIKKPIMDAEEEAWDFAEKSLFKKAKNYALDMYLSNWAKSK